MGFSNAHKIDTSMFNWTKLWNKEGERLTFPFVKVRVYTTFWYPALIHWHQGHREFPFGNSWEFDGVESRPEITGNFLKIRLYSIFTHVFLSSCIFYFRQPILRSKIAVPQSKFQIQISFSEFIFRSFRFGSDTTPPEVQNKTANYSMANIASLRVFSDNLICIHRINNDFEAQSESQ